MAKKIILTFFSILTFTGFIVAQEPKDIGLQVGGSYYMGDYNYGTPLYQPSIAVGAIYRYNFNGFYSFRLSADYSLIRGSYSSFSHYLPGLKGSFSKSIIGAEALYEINFMAFNTKHLKKEKFAPYVILGVGGAYINGELLAQLPFGIGVKYCPFPRIAIGWEWRLSKTFSDNIDNYNNVYDGSKEMFHNNDWYSFFGLFVTYRLHNKKYTCPVYQK